MVHAGVELGEGPVGLDLVDHQDGAAALRGAGDGPHVIFELRQGGEGAVILASGVEVFVSEVEPAGEVFLWEGVGHPGSVGLGYVQGLADSEPAVWEVEKPGPAGVAGPL